MMLRLLLLLSLVAAPVAAQTMTEDTLVVNGGTLHGSLLLPAAPSGRMPVVLLHPGSGPTDRNGNSAIAGRTEALRMLAEGLAAAGIASLRIDKRGIGASLAAMQGGEADLRFTDYVDDAEAWLRHLKADARFSRVIAVGHSEGALITLLAARRGAADAYVSIAGPGRRAGDVLRTQLAALPADLAAENTRILAALEAGTTAANVPMQLQALYRPSVQPYLISWLRFVPADELRALEIPALLVQGTHDGQVPMTEFEVLTAAKPAAPTLVLPGMTHVLKTGPADLREQMRLYSDPTAPLTPGLVDGIVAFIRSLPTP